MRGLAAGGVAPVGKHFPGHGATTVDSHQRLPVVAASMARLHAHDLAPFRAAIRSGLDAVMVGHLVVRAVDPRTPATLSPAVVGDLLRERMGFGGLVVSDALEMGAIATTVTLPVAAERALVRPGSTSSSSPATAPSRPSWTTSSGRSPTAASPGTGSARPSCGCSASSGSTAGPAADRRAQASRGWRPRPRRRPPRR